MDKRKQEQETGRWKTVESNQPLEDRALKMAAQFFGTELLPRLGIPGKVRRIAPTEQVHLEMKDFFEDFNFEMENGVWYHFEFESDAITKKDLIRFRSYESVTSYYYGVEVITYVICTVDVASPMMELKQGINRYRVQVIHLKEKDADLIIEMLEEKQRSQRLGRGDLAELLLTPLMSGKKEISERIEKSVRLIQQEGDLLGKEDLLRMESVLYTFAMKFLSKVELKNIQEVFEMTILGQMLEAKGIEKGIEQGIEEGMKVGMAQGIIKTYKKLNASKENTRVELISEAKLTEEEADAYLLKYWES